MNPMGLMEMAQIKEQEHMREALRRTALREARKQAGVTWIQVVRARLFGPRGVVTTPATAAAPRSPAPAPAPAAPNSVAPATNTRPVLVHEVRIRQHAAAQLRVVEAAERDCVGADC